MVKIFKITILIIPKKVLKKADMMNLFKLNRKFLILTVNCKVIRVPELSINKLTDLILKQIIGWPIATLNK